MHVITIGWSYSKADVFRLLSVSMENIYLRGSWKGSL